MSRQWILTFPALEAIQGITHGFICRHPDIDVQTDRDTALARLEPHFASCLAVMDIPPEHLATGEQIHDCRVRVCGNRGVEKTHSPDTDGLATGQPEQYLGIYVADCGAVYFVDPIQRACALVHSGRKGTELGIAARAIETMTDSFGSDPADIVVQLAPCIRPPDYEIDFAARIRKNCIAAGIRNVNYHDCGISTAQNIERYYSYRMEQGKTGRLLAVLGFDSQ